MKKSDKPAQPAPRPAKVNLLGVKGSPLSWPKIRDAIKAEKTRGGDRAALRAVVISALDEAIKPKSPILEWLSDLGIRAAVPVVFALADLAIDAATGGADHA